MLLSIIIPYFNEPTLPEVIDNIYNVNFQEGISIEIIAIDDGSTDGTTALLNEQIKKYTGIKLFKHPKNRGKGAAIKTGLLLCSGDIIIIQDADLEYNPSDIPKVIQPIIDKKTLVCYGSRHLSKVLNKSNLLWLRKHVSQAILPYLGGRIITATCNIMFFIMLTDILTCYKAFDAHLIKHLPLKNNGFEMEGELTARILRKATIIEVPVTYVPRTIDEGKKIRLKDGVKFLFALIKYRFA